MTGSGTVPPAEYGSANGCRRRGSLPGLFDDSLPFDDREKPVDGDGAKHFFLAGGPANFKIHGGEGAKAKVKS